MNFSPTPEMMELPDESRMNPPPSISMCLAGSEELEYLRCRGR
jgi:hypothetical protein